jgi:solute carrier family 35 protein F3/4
MYMYALSVLDATDVMALFATNVSFVYLLSWVVLHDQFVGLRVNNLKKKQKKISIYTFLKF